MCNATTKCPNDTTANDYNIYVAICTEAKKCNHIRTSFQHVKGHQDKDPKRPLTCEEQLNVECNRRAKRYTTSVQQSSTACGNPRIPMAQPHLIIGNKTICRNVLTALWQATSVPPYRKDMIKKNNWTTRDFDNVDWTTVNSALSSFKLEDQRRLILFIHEKLPLWASKAHLHHGSKLCLSCQREPEEAKHLLECSHPEQKKLFSDLKQTLTLYTQKIKLHPCLFMTLWLGLVTTQTATPYPNIADEVPTPIQSTIQSQTQLGWRQTYYGQVANEWAATIDELHPQIKGMGAHIILHIVKIIWTYFLNLWKACNTHLHQNASMPDQPNYKQAAETLYAQRHKLSLRAQEALYKKPLQQILELPPPRLQQWVIRGYQYFTKQLQAEKQQATIGTPDIQTFFWPSAQQPDDLHPPWDDPVTSH